jgi:serine protease SohB
VGEFFFSYGLFLAKLLTLLLAVGVLVALIAAVGGRTRSTDRGTIEVTRLNEALEQGREVMHACVLDPADYKASVKAKNKQDKAEAKARKAAAKRAAKKRGDGTTVVDEKRRRRVYLIDFEGDIRASQVSALRREITAVLTLADTYDEVVVRVESGGGTVHGYGLAASQLQRIRDQNVSLTVCVDKVAASGGYLMACVADKIRAAPFALVGSIGVMAQIPNVHRLLKRHDIDVELMTAGEYKRTLTVLGENTDKGREKFLAELEEIHSQFKNFISRFRPQTNIAEVSTGEVWSGEAALARKLVDELGTSDEYIVEACEQADVFRVKYEERKTLPEKFGLAASQAAVKTVEDIAAKALAKRFL